ncbi:MAG: hypothetical protein AAGA42_06715 [Actinomycetota bacterium]
MTLGTRRTTTVASLLLAALITACAQSDDEAQAPESSDTSPVERTATTTSPTEKTSTELVTGSAPSSSAGTVASTTTEPADEPAPFPPPGLPIVWRHEFDQPVWTPLERDGALLLAGPSRVQRFDVDDRTETTQYLAADDELFADVVFLTNAGPNVAALASTFGLTTFDLALTIDAQTLERGPSLRATPGDVYVPNGGTGAPADSDDPQMLAFPMLGNRGVIDVFDTSTAAVVGPAPDTLQPNALIERIDDEFWVWATDGTGRVVDVDSGDIVAELDAGQILGPSPGHVVFANDDSVWLATTGAQGDLLRFDRGSYEVTQRLDLSDRYGPDTAVDVQATSRNNPFVIVQVDRADEGWYILLQLDPTSGDIVSEHTIAPSAHEYGWFVDRLPYVVTIGERVFVFDHVRSVVELDTEQLENVTDSWVDPGVTPTPVLDDDEAALARLMLDTVARVPVPLTNPELGALALASLARTEGASETIWEVQFAVVDGDRGWGQIRPEGSDQIGFPMSFRRIDGEWRIDSLALCTVAIEATSGEEDPCGLLGG